jgi:hypothetical protein
MAAAHAADLGEVLAAARRVGKPGTVYPWLHGVLARS